MSVGKLIKCLRAVKDMSQMELAEVIGYSRSYVSLLESDKRKPFTEDLAKIAEHFGLPVELFAEGAMDSVQNRRILADRLADIICGLDTEPAQT